MTDETAHLNQRWSTLLVEELLRNGIDQFCLSPGSRSTPLTVAIARSSGARITHFDERGAAFFALGYGRATGRPAVVVTTSGTAVANLLPAIVEASMDGVPMLILTADRPPELRDTGANQAIFQTGIFGSYVRWSFDLPVPDAHIRHQMVQTTVDQAVYRALRSPAGPVHLNCPFREPFLPDTTETIVSRGDEEEASGPLTWYASTVETPATETVDRVLEAVGRAGRGVIVAGALRSRAEAEAAASLAQVMGWPLLPDVLSQMRLSDVFGGNIIHHHAQILKEGGAEPLMPDVILHLGGRITSKRLGLLPMRPEVNEYIMVVNRPERLDPHHTATIRIEATVEAFARAMIPAFQFTVQDTVFLDAWKEAEQAAKNEARAQGDRLDESTLATLVTRLLPVEHGLVLAASMPVRDVESFGNVNTTWNPVIANRGASGIDGTAATAVGFAAGTRAPVTLLIGDLAMLHDLNSLVLVSRSEYPVVVVVVNNNGGAIFDFLPVSRQTDVFEPYFVLPHGLHFRAAAEMFGLAYHVPTTPDDFIEAYLSACTSGRSELIEVRTERSWRIRNPL